MGRRADNPEIPFRIIAWVLAVFAVTIVVLYRVGFIRPSGSELKRPFASPSTIVMPATSVPAVSASAVDATDALSEFADDAGAVPGGGAWPGGHPILLPYRHQILVQRLRAAGPNVVAVERCRHTNDLDDELQASIQNYADSLTAAFLDAGWNIVSGPEDCGGRTDGTRLLVAKTNAALASQVVDAFAVAGIPLEVIESGAADDVPTPLIIQVDWHY